MDHCIRLSFDNLVKIRIIDYAEAQKPFVHQNRCIDYNVFLFLVSGQMKIWEDNKEYVINQNEIFFLKSGLHHWGTEEIPKGTKWYYIHFYNDNKKNIDSNTNNNIAFVKNQEFLVKDYDNCILLPKQLSIATPSLMNKRLNNLCEIFHSENSLRLVQLSLSVTEIFYEIYNSHKSRLKADKADIITQKIIEYLQERLSSKISSLDISKHVLLNYNYVSQMFKNKTGVSITEYHTRLRITEACRLLRKSSLNISEVSDAIGYADALYFSHVFKKVIGISPSEYQKQIYSLNK